MTLDTKKRLSKPKHSVTNMRGITYDYNRDTRGDTVIAYNR